MHLKRDKLTAPRVTRINVITFHVQITETDLINKFIPIPTSSRSAARDVGDIREIRAKLKLLKS